MQHPLFFHMLKSECTRPKNGPQELLPLMPSLLLICIKMSIVWGAEPYSVKHTLQKCIRKIYIYFFFRAQSHLHVTCSMRNVLWWHSFSIEPNTQCTITQFSFFLSVVVHWQPIHYESCLNATYIKAELYSTSLQRCGVLELPTTKICLKDLTTKADIRSKAPTCTW